MMIDPKRGIRLDWAGEMVPHAVLDLLRGCNAACQGCYNANSGLRLKPLSQIKDELRTLVSLRRLQALSLTGGEPMLHPDLEAVVSEVHALGLRSVLMTNGLCLDSTRARRLKSAGLDMVLLHIQCRQNRPDCPGDDRDALLRLRRAKAECARSAGIDVGYSALMYPDAGGKREIQDLIDEVKSSEAVHFLMICPQGDFEAFAGLRGDFANGYYRSGEGCPNPAEDASVDAEAEALYGLLHESGFGLFAWLGSSADPGELRWSTWGSGVLRGETTVQALPLRPAWTDRLLIRLVRLVSGRNLMHVRPSTARFRIQLLLSLLSVKTNRAALSLLAGSFRADRRLERKHVMVELPPVRKPDGRVVFCQECPDATLHDGRLVPPCLIDRMTALPFR